MKVIVIGCTHAGTAAVNQILASNPDTEVILKAYFIPVLNS